MKRKVLVAILMSCISLISVNAQITGRVSINENEISISKMDGFDVISWNKTTDKNSQIGAPEIPVLIQTFVVPQNTKVKSVDITLESRVKLNGTFVPYPVQTPIPTSNDDFIFTQPDSSIYHSETVYPNMKAQLVAEYNEMGYHLVTVCLYPIEWEPETKSLYLCNLSFVINYIDDDVQQVQPVTQSSRRTKSIQKLIKSKVQNPQDVGVLPYQQREESNVPMLKSQSLKYINRIEEHVPDYIIITNKELKNTFQQLADWKTQRGVPTLIQDVETIKDNYSGSDLSEKIHSYLQECYHKWGAGLFVLLGGDVNVVPARVYKDDDAKFYPSDAYYMDLECNWNANKNNLFAERTLDGAEMKMGKLCYVGRAPVKNSLEAANFINKVLAYEKMDDIKTDKNYLMNHLVADAYISKDTKQNKDSLYNGAQQEIYNYFKSLSQLHTWFLFDHYNCSCSKHASVGPFTNGEELNRKNFLSSLNGTGNSGWGYPHIVYHMDHSHSRCLGTSSLDKGEYFSVANADAQTNHHHLHIMISGGCEPATFTEDCIAEHCMNNPHGGAIAFIGNANQGISYEYKQYKNFLNSLYKNQIYSLGGIFQSMTAQTTNGARSQQKITQYKEYFRLQLLGDPELPVWSEVPKDLDVLVTPEEFQAGENILSIKINNLPIGEEATVCIMKDADVYGIYEVSDRELHRFSFAPKMSGDLKVTVTVHNFRPYVKTIPIELFEGHLLSVETMNDYLPNLELMAGDTVDLRVVLKNNGTEMVKNVVATLTTSSPYIDILNNTVRYDTICAGQHVKPLSPFRVKVAKNAPNIGKNEWNAACFYLTMVKDGAQSVDIDTFRVNLQAPSYQLTTITASPIKSGDLIIEPNCYVVVRTDVVNKGGGRRSYDIDAMPIDSQYIEIVSKGMYGHRYSMKINDSYVVGKPLRIKIKVSAIGIPQDSAIVDLTKIPDKPNSLNVHVDVENDAISFYWDKMGTETLYNIYRSDKEKGTYTKLNKTPLTFRYYKDEGLEKVREYYYKLAVLGSNKMEGFRSSPIKACTTYPATGLFPLVFSDGNWEYINEAHVADINYDGQKEIVMAARNYNKKQGRIAVVQPDGMEPYDIDGNVTSFSGFANIPWCTEATPVVADIYGDAVPHLVVLTRNYVEMDNNAVICYSSQDNDSDRLPDVKWQKEINVPCYRSAVVTDITAPDGKGEKEIIFRGDNKGPITVLDANGVRKRQMGSDMKGFYGGLAVADLDGDGYKEIICGSDSNLYVWEYGYRVRGEFYKREPFFTRKGYTLSSSPVVCDLDGDGEKEIIVASRNDSRKISYVYAIKQDGTCVGHFDSNSASPAVIPYTGVDHAVSVGDINGDKRLEVVAIGTGCVCAWNHNGEILFNRSLPGIFAGAGNSAVPILADVDGDSVIDIIFNDKDKIYALHNDGTDVKGFPLNMAGESIGSVSVSDFDDDGYNEIIAGDRKSYIYVWKTTGKSSAIEWGRARHNTEFTGEYIPQYKDPWVITSDTEWTGGLFTNDIIVRSGTFRIPTGKILQMQEYRRIFIMDGAALEVDGGLITNADIRVMENGHLKLKNNGIVRLHKKGALVSKATFSTSEMSNTDVIEIEHGEIQIAQ